jgi:hypothetical protein
MADIMACQKFLTCLLRQKCPRARAASSMLNRWLRSPSQVHTPLAGVFTFAFGPLAALDFILTRLKASAWNWVSDQRLIFLYLGLLRFRISFWCNLRFSFCEGSFE